VSCSCIEAFPEYTSAVSNPRPLLCTSSSGKHTSRQISTTFPYEQWLSSIVPGLFHFCASSGQATLCQFSSHLKLLCFWRTPACRRRSISLGTCMFNLGRSNNTSPSHMRQGQPIIAACHGKSHLAPAYLIMRTHMSASPARSELGGGRSLLQLKLNDLVHKILRIA